LRHVGSFRAALQMGRILPEDRLSEGQQYLVKAWSYDAEACRAYRLEGSATVTR
jgi:hypothetical protein